MLSSTSRLSNAPSWLISILLFSILDGGIIGVAADSVFPANRWATASAVDVGLEQEQVDAALAEWARRTGPDGVSKTVIVRHGRLIHAGPWATDPNGLYSSTKSFTSTCLGLLIADGTVRLDTSAATIEPALQGLYPDATLRHFTTMTSGYSGKGISRWDAENTDWSYTPYVPTRPHFAPGTAYAYWDEAQMMFGRLLTIAAERDLYELMLERVFDPIGIESASWGQEGSVEVNGQSVPIRNGCTWLKTNAVDLARFGHLMLNDGRWDGRQIVPSAWVKQATSPQVSRETPIGDTDRRHVDGRGCYGFNWWVNGRRPDGELLMPDAPEGAFFSAGLKHNVCLVIPAWDMVIVRLGKDHNPPDGHAAVLNDVAKLLRPRDVEE